MIYIGNEIDVISQNEIERKTIISEAWLNTMVAYDYALLFLARFYLYFYA